MGKRRNESRMRDRHARPSSLSYSYAHSLGLAWMLKGIRDRRRRVNDRMPLWMSAASVLMFYSVRRARLSPSASTTATHCMSGRQNCSHSSFVLKRLSLPWQPP